MAGGQHSWQMAPLQCHVLDLGARAWSRFGTADPSLQVCRHAGDFADGFLMLFGGHDGDSLSNELRRIQAKKRKESGSLSPPQAKQSKSLVPVSPHEVTLMPASPSHNIEHLE